MNIQFSQLKNNFKSSSRDKSNPIDISEKPLEQVSSGMKDSQIEIFSNQINSPSNNFIKIHSQLENNPFKSHNSKYENLINEQKNFGNTIKTTSIITKNGNITTKTTEKITKIINNNDNSGNISKKEFTNISEKIIYKEKTDENTNNIDYNTTTKKDNIFKQE